MQPAPFFDELAKGPDGGAAYWLNTADDIRIRIGVWPTGSRGTVLMLPGRVEYIEKYGPTAKALSARGYASVAIDWRGQGLAQRLIADAAPGHVEAFSDYQQDVAAMVAALRELGLPEPHYMLAHSMGGCIGTRALSEGLTVNAAAMTAPMWGIQISPWVRPFAWGLSRGVRNTRFKALIAPGTSARTYVLAEPFAGNILTSDPDMYAEMQAQARQRPELTIGGPSLGWLYEALKETRRLRRTPAPSVPLLVFMAQNEKVVRNRDITGGLARWPGANSVMVEGAEHELLWENPAIRRRVITRMISHFEAHPRTQAAQASGGDI